MQKQDNFSTPDVITNDDVISLTDILAPLWRSRWMILLVTLSVAALGLAGSQLFAQYKSEGYFQFGGAIPADKDKEPPGISFSDFKRYAASYMTSERFADFVRDKKLETTTGIDSLTALFASRDGLGKQIEPIYPFTKLDAKELVEQPKGISNNVIGLRINYTNRSPELAQQMVVLLGRYVMDSIAYQIYSDELQFKHGEIQAKMTWLENVIITNQELLEKYHRKGTDLKKIVSRYPDSTRQASRQVVSVTEDNARYLSPVTLLVTTEVQASEANESIRKAKRDLRQYALWLEYYDHAKVLLDQTKSGETVLRGLESVKVSVFKGKNLQDDVIKEVYNMITIDNQNAINLYLEKCRFIAGPNLPAHSTARPLLTSAMGTVLGLFLSVLLVFARNWWRGNWQKITG
ncbi:MAG: lipopolysaccharide biosynthesis protein [Nitrosomonadales bacterium]|nr:lipopolysaccharide biosynthesis protein [Nitrosomonadales bacterium]